MVITGLGQGLAGNAPKNGGGRDLPPVVTSRPENYGTAT
jgi:hypothetical protein